MDNTAINAREVFAYNLQFYMRLRNIDQSDIVERLHVSASTVSDWVNGKKYPRVDAMQRLADLLNILMSDLTSVGKADRGWYIPIIEAYSAKPFEIQNAVCKILDLPHIKPPQND